MIASRAELLDAIENTVNKINALKEMITKTSDEETASQLRDKLNILLHNHYDYIDQLG
jgi:hypothetical protein